jgi:hypothetical protein
MKMLIEDIERNGERGREALPAASTEITDEMRSEAEQIVSEASAEDANP